MAAISVWPRRALAGQLLYGLLWLGVTGFGLALHPDPSGHGTHQELGLPPCPSSLFFDRPCPGCGLTTSFTALLHGNLSLAFHAHPLGPFLYLFLAVTGWLALARFFQGKRLDVTSKPWMTGIIAGAAIFLAFGIWRMATTDHYRSPDESFELQAWR